MSGATSTHSSGVGALGLMSCVRESSPLQDFDSDNEKNVSTKKKMSWNPKKWFRRKNKGSEDAVTQHDVVEIVGKDPLRSRSTSELSEADEQIRRRSGSSIQAGLSVSHDSVFHSPHSGSESDLEAAQSSSSLSNPPHRDLRFQTELTERLRLRRHRGDTSEDDEGLPHSPCNSPSTTEGFLDKTANKDLPAKSHSTTCSDGSLLSMCSSDIEEDSFGQQSKHSSRISLHDKKSGEIDSDLDLSSTTAPLNHSAAHHRVAVRPKRTHGAPRKKRVPQLSSALPTTPEVNEDSSVRSLSPENIIKGTSTEFYSSNTVQLTSEIKSKSSSLPLGTPSNLLENKLSRSHSNASSKQDSDNPLFEEEEEKDTGKSFFDRILYRKSGKKKKSKEEKTTQEKFSSVTSVDSAVSSSYSKHEYNVYINSQSHSVSESKPIIPSRTGVNARQRIQPMDLPGSPEPFRHEISPNVHPKTSPDKIHSGSSPLSQELDNLFKQNRIQPTSPTKPSDLLFKTTSPRSPRAMRPFGKADQLAVSPTNSELPPISPINKYEHFTKSSVYSTRLVETKKEVKYDDVRSKMKLVGLSPLQEKILSTNDEADEMAFKSLTDFSTTSEELKKTITKSHSFKCDKQNLKETDYRFTKPSAYPYSSTNDDQRKSMIKASSLDSVKNLDDLKENKEFEFPVQLDKQELLKEMIISEVQREIMENSCKREKLTDQHDRKTEQRSFVAPTNSIKEESVYPSKKNETKRVSSFNKDFRKSDKKLHVNRDIKDLPAEKDDKPTEEKYCKLKMDEKQEESKTESTEINNITITGPSHTAILNVTNTTTQSSYTSSKSESTLECFKKPFPVDKKEVVNSFNVIKEQNSLVTNIQLKRDTNLAQKNGVPEFITRQLNKVECKPTTTVVCSINSPKILDEQTRPKTLLLFDQDSSKQATRKFSAEDIEIINKEEKTTEVIVSATKSSVIVSAQPRFKKNESSKGYQRKSSVISITPETPKKERPPLKLRSVSLDSLKNDADISDNNKSSQDSLDEIDKDSQTSLDSHNDKKSSVSSDACVQEGVICRKKSFASQNSSEDQPELMKVFARRSLKLKDSESDSLSQQVAVMISESQSDSKVKDGSDKENQTDSPPERKRSFGKEITDKEPLTELSEGHKIVPNDLSSNLETSKIKEVTNQTHKITEKSKTKDESLEHQLNQKTVETKLVDTKSKEPEEVTLRKNPLNNKFAFQQRAFSVQPPKMSESNEFLKKQSIFQDRRKTDNWFSNVKNDEDKKIIRDEFVSKSEIISEELICESKNFNQRKAIWEKRAQESQKKSVP